MKCLIYVEILPNKIKLLVIRCKNDLVTEVLFPGELKWENEVMAQFKHAFSFCNKND